MTNKDMAAAGDTRIGRLHQPRILVFHPVLWSHYKGAVFSALHEECVATNLSLHVVQVAATEGGRKGFGNIDRNDHKYPHQVLFQDSYENVSLARRLRAIMSVILSERWQVVIIPGYYEPAMWVAAIVAKARGAKIVIANDSTERDRIRDPLKEWVKRQIVKMCDLAFCYGARAREYVVTLGMPIERTVIHCQATDNESIQRLHAEFSERRQALQKESGISERNFIFVGRLSSEKNVDSLLAAFAMVADKIEDWGLIIVGDGPEQTRLERSVSPQFRHRVTFVGGKGWREVPQYYAMADVLVLPSSSEPWGLVVNEALTCGLPVLVSEGCGCVPELVLDGVTGFSFDPTDSKRLAELMRAIACDGGMRAKMSRSASQIAAQYTPQRAAQEMCKGLMRFFPSDAS